MTEQAPTVETVSATDSALSLLEEKFRNAVRRDDREGYDGLIVDPPGWWRSRPPSATS